MDEALDDNALLTAPEVAESGAPLALYRRYRPDVFAEVIGQEHVTDPLQRALTNNKVNHAYLFSGPRGCGKTTSARILARALNCEQGPTPTPCGACDSCVALARGGPGSIDVIEIDAASHGGVDDARDLRERAFFSPVSSRYKIYIVDEAHMVSPAGFNALLKLVEEPPPHVKFIFATTEPDKVIGTIRSRTHHYPFRLVPPRTLGAYLAKLCEAEGVEVAQGVLPLVVRAGAGSVRDSLSVLDQLLGGASEEGVSYEHATSLLGYTPDSLLDEIVDAFAAGDAAGVFAAVDKVIEVGQDPRRFAEDLLRRLRDLVIVAAVPNAVSSGLVDVAADQADRLQSQSAALGHGELTRAAEVIADGLTEMRGTTAPRLHLELMCSRVLLPGADVDDRGIHARIDRLERRVGMMAPGEDLPAAAPTRVARPAEPVDAVVDHGTQTSGQRPGRPVDSGPAEARPVSEPQPPAPPVREEAQEKQPAPAAAEPTPAPQGGRGPSVTDVRRLWPEILEELRGRRRFTWILVTQNAHVVDVNGGTLVLGFKNAGARDNFAKGGSEDVLAESLIQVMGAQLRVEAIVDPSGGGGGSRTSSSPPGRPPGSSPASVPDGGGAARPEPSSAASSPAPNSPPSAPTPADPTTSSNPARLNPTPPAPQQSSGSPQRPADQAEANGRSRARATQPRSDWEPGPEPYDPDAEPPPDPGFGGAPRFGGQGPAPSPRDTAAVRENIRPTRRQGPTPSSPETAVEEVADRDDAVVNDSVESHAELLARQLGAEIIDEDPQTT
ncbi:DNA polymerase III subunit gamma and tau [Propionibacteriaceae bacterium Y1700]|uniref:DNA polymerase III subunit gamma and tau n=1 Tax=Microlunatus sp. Y1700 TaxID=3418487 RepID=UPI003DA76FB7